MKRHISKLEIEIPGQPGLGWIWCFFSTRSWTCQGDLIQVPRSSSSTCESCCMDRLNGPGVSRCFKPQSRPEFSRKFHGNVLQLEKTGVEGFERWEWPASFPKRGIRMSKICQFHHWHRNLLGENSDSPPLWIWNVWNIWRGLHCTRTWRWSWQRFLSSTAPAWHALMFNTASNVAVRFSELSSWSMTWSHGLFTYVYVGIAVTIGSTCSIM